ncbi:MAG: peptidase domain-containing ABC transporter [Pseudanabaenaceae cyanobacterium]
MTSTASSVQEFIASLPYCQALEPEVRNQFVQQLQPIRYRMGQIILRKETMPAQVLILWQGQARLLGQAQKAPAPETIQRLNSGAIVGWIGLLRRHACETVIASTESICLAIDGPVFLEFLAKYPRFAEHFYNQPNPIEVFELLAAELDRGAQSVTDLPKLARTVLDEAVALHRGEGSLATTQLDPNFIWFVSGGAPCNVEPMEKIPPDLPRVDVFVEPIQAKHGITTTRFVGFRPIPVDLPEKAETESEAETWEEDIPFAPDLPPAAIEIRSNVDYPHVFGRGPVDASLACLEMLAKLWRIPFRRHVLRRALVNQFERTNKVSLQACAAMAELMGVTSQLVKVPAVAVQQLPTPAILPWQDTFAVLYKANSKEVVLGIPEQGIVTKSVSYLAENWRGDQEVIIVAPNKETPKQKFGLAWFGPAILKYRGTLITVLVASFFVQLLGLANPLITQVIIDKVLIQNSPATLNTLGTLLIVLAVFEAVLTALRTYLFVNTSNRIDMMLGAETIDHLLRLPLRYFERRPVGELSSRIGELENIRSFLTGTALTVVLDAIFSVIYIVVMWIYSWVLTLVALATVPLFALLTFIVAPIIRGQLRNKAERNAETQSYLVEVLSGIQTVKAQNIELRSRWEWQKRYARYISDGFRTVVTSTTAGSTSSFLNQFSGLLLLWVGAYLVLKGELTLGQLIAFRIIAGYTTSPLLRLIQLYQNFQETALSLERLSDIINHPQEQEEAGRRNIPMPLIQGSVKYENLTFRFASSAAPQLVNINLDLPVGTFVGVVGQSGAGKSTLTKLLPRLYEPEAGRILIDGYDISKVELYSLRRQIGMVLQDTLLFDGTVQENISLTNPDATPEQIIDAARIACAHDFIMGLPQGYETRVGERGAALSGGQRQRIAIARTILQNPRFLVLDEATSALDYNTERQVCLNLAEACKGRTVFFITHRLATIRSADVIVVMDAGTVAEKGTHDELMALKERYYCLYLQQEASSGG